MDAAEPRTETVVIGAALPKSSPAETGDGPCLAGGPQEPLYLLRPSCEMVHLEALRRCPRRVPA